MCHNPAICFNVSKRGFIRPGYHADLVLIDPSQEWKVRREDVLYKCGWSPLEGEILHGAVTHTFINGNLAYNRGVFDETVRGERLKFDR